MIRRPAARYGFQIDDYADLHGWRVIDLTGVPLTVVTACPADGTPLKVLCTLTARHDRVQIRIGCCSECGHITYIDRPTQDWIVRYYQDAWDADRRTAGAQAAIVSKLAGPYGEIEPASVRLARTLAIDRSLPVCEIGCGFGNSLRQLAAAGFTRLVGVEPSRHRAEIARSTGVDVLMTPFESSETQDVLRARAPFGLILTFHALEHTYDPEAVFAAAAALQAPGGHFIVSVPNQEGEPSMGILLFLPHMHSFTQASLARLAARHGYEVADVSASTAKNLNVVFRRTSAPAAVAPDCGAYGRALDKIVTGLDLDRSHVGRRRLWWLRRADVGGQVWAGPPDSLGERNWQRFVERERIDRPRSVLVSSLRRLSGTANGCPLQIQFRDRVALFFK